MTDGIGRILGGNNYNIGGYVPQRKEAAKEETAQPQQNYQDTQIDPDKVMDFLQQYNFFVQDAAQTEGVELDKETSDRIAGYMEQFEMIYSVVAQEFGEKIAPKVMDLVMDKLMGLDEMAA